MKSAPRSTGSTTAPRPLPAAQRARLVDALAHLLLADLECEDASEQGAVNGGSR